MIQQAHPQPAPDLTRQRRHDPQGRLVGQDQGIHQGNGLRRLARQQGIAHLQAGGGLAADQGRHRRGGDGSTLPHKQGQFLQFAGQAGTVAADGLRQGLRGGGLEPQAQLPGRAGHQLHLAGAIPHRWQGKAAFRGLAGLHQLLQDLGGAQAAIGLARIHQQQMALIRDQLQAGLEGVGQLGGALVTERTALQQHHPIP